MEPIDQVTHDFRLKAAFSRETWQLQIAYGLSVFRNSLDAVAADNPCFGVATVCSASDAGGPSRGQIALTPDNTANTIAIAGGVNVPFWRTRLSGSATYSLRLQDQSFLPQTINPILIAATNPALLALPAKSLDGTVGITTANLNATSRPLPPLTLTLRYRLFDFNDMTDGSSSRANVVSASVTAEAHRATRVDRDQNVQHQGPLARSATMAAWASAAGGKDPSILEPRGRVCFVAYVEAYVDVAPAEWLVARLTYRPSFRRHRRLHHRGRVRPHDRR